MAEYKNKTKLRLDYNIKEGENLVDVEIQNRAHIQLADNTDIIYLGIRNLFGQVGVSTSSGQTIDYTSNEYLTDGSTIKEAIRRLDRAIYNTFIMTITVTPSGAPPPAADIVELLDPVTENTPKKIWEQTDTTYQLHPHALAAGCAGYVNRFGSDIVYLAGGWTRINSTGVTSPLGLASEDGGETFTEKAISNNKHPYYMNTSGVYPAASDHMCRTMSMRLYPTTITITGSWPRSRQWRIRTDCSITHINNPSKNTWRDVVIWPNEAIGIIGENPKADEQGVMPTDNWYNASNGTKMMVVYDFNQLRIEAWRGSVDKNSSTAPENPPVQVQTLTNLQSNLQTYPDTTTHLCAFFYEEPLTGDLICIMRRAKNTNFFYCRSTDTGSTWTAAVSVGDGTELGFSLPGDMVGSPHSIKLSNGNTLISYMRYSPTYQRYYLEWKYSNNLGTQVEWKTLTKELTGEHKPPTGAVIGSQSHDVYNTHPNIPRRAPSVQIGEGGDIYTYWVREGDGAGAPNCQIWRYRVTLA